MPDYRELAAGQRSQVWIGGPTAAQPELIFESDDILIEAPNWTHDGGSLILNGNGLIWKLEPTSGGRLEKIDSTGLPPVNNDHVLDPDGQHIYLSAVDKHIYRGNLAGGPVTRVTPDDGRWHFLHGVSPDGRRLAYVEIEDFARPSKLVILDEHGGVSSVPVGEGHLDGPEWSPEGQWIYLNTEMFTGTPGHAQIARVPDGGGAVERLISSDTVDWFPHLSPDGKHASYIVFPPGTIGHPADREVEVRVASTEDWAAPLQRYRLFGGQGTINVNSWAPDSRRLAFVAYPRA